MTTDSTHQTAPAATSEDLRAASFALRAWAMPHISGSKVPDRLDALASLLPALLDTLSVEDLRAATKRAGSWAEVDPLSQRLNRAADALAALKEAE